MRIGLLSTSFPRAPSDVPGAFVLGFAQALAERGHTVEVLAPAPSEIVYRDTPAWPGVSVTWVPYAPRALQTAFYGAGVLDNLRAAPLSGLWLPPFVAQLALATRARVSGWDAVISHWALPCALVAGELRGARPHLAVLHSADVFLLERLPGVLKRVLATRIARTADSLLFSSRDLRRRFLALLSPLTRGEVTSRAHVCPMGIAPAEESIETRASVRARLQIDRFTVLSLGRLIALKGVDNAISALASMPDSELIVCGQGPEQQALAALASQRGARVRFLGNVFGRDKADLFRAADAFVLPSIVLPDGRSEGMPQTLLEAMEHGLPVVASDVGGISDVVRSDENGFLVPAGDASAIAQALEQLRSNSVRERLCQGARETARLYHWSELAPMIESLLTR